MSQNKIFQYWLDQAKTAGYKQNSLEAMEWFRQKIRKNSKAKYASIVSNRRRNPLKVGQMVTYVYDAKYKKTLPYWDMTPLIVLLDFTDNGWYGANLHYLSPQMRVRLLWSVRPDRNTLMQIRHELTKNPNTRPCLKRYLSAQLRSKPVQIPKGEWGVAIQMPYENFKKADRKKVWRDSRNTVRR